jgi:methionyl-tRNA formyltransferase
VLVGLSGSLPFPVPGSGLMGFRQLSRTYGIPLVLSEDFSGEGTVSQLRNQGVELFVTSMCDQILREPLLSLPRHGCVNLHASLLPEFRGVDSTFQSMLHDAPEAGVTLHQTTARIDCGNVYAQASFPRAAGDSHLLLTVKATTAGVPLLKRHVLALERGETPPSWPLDVSKARFPYRSWPERDELRRFSERGLSFWRSSDLLRILRFDESLAPHQ